MPGWAFRARRMIRGMGLMLFPRYIQREARDFFYLTARSVLPGAPIPPSMAAADGGPATLAPAAEAGEGVWKTKGLPQHGFPYALATTWVRGDAGQRIQVVRVDPRTMQPATGRDQSIVLAIDAGARGPQSLWWSDGAFAIGAEPPHQGAIQLAGGFPPQAAQAAVARAAVGVQDDDGMLVWVELSAQERADSRAAAAMDSVLERLGCSTRIALAGGARALLGGALDVAGDAGTPAPATAHRFERIPGPDAHPIFADTPLVPIQVWRPLQAKRVRYFYKPATSASSVTAAPPPSGTSAERAPIRVQSRP